MKIKSYPVIVLCLIFLFLPLPIFSDDIEDSKVVISEILYNPSTDQCQNDLCEWVELTNFGDKEVDLSGWLLDGKVLSSLIIKPDEYLVVSRKLIGDPNSDSFEAFWGNNSGIWGDDSEKENYQAVQLPISLTNNPGDSIVLENPVDGYKDIIDYKSSQGANGNGRSLERNPNSFDQWNESYESYGTPGKINNRAPNIPIGLSIEDGTTQNLKWEETIDPDGHPITFYLLEIYEVDLPTPTIIEEITATNYQTDNLKIGEYYFHVAATDSSLVSDFSDPFYFSIVEAEYSNKIVLTEIFPDPVSPLNDSDDEAIELYNSGTENINLSGWILRDTEGSTKEYEIGNTIISSKKYIVFYSRDTKITLNNDGDSVELLDPNRKLVFSTPNFGKTNSGLSFALMDDGQWLWVDPTLGGKNLYPSGGVVLAASSKVSQSTSATSENPTIKKDELISFAPVVLGSDSRSLTKVVLDRSNSDKEVTTNSKNQTTLWTAILLSACGLLFILFYPWKKKDSMF